MPAAFRAAGRLPAAGFGANFQPSHLIRGRRALSPSSTPGERVGGTLRWGVFLACSRAAFRGGGRLPAAGFGANFKPTRLIRGRRALSPSSPSALEFVMATPESPRPPIVMSRLDYDRIEALIESANDRGVDTTALEAEITRADVVEPAQMPGDVISMNSTARFLDATKIGRAHVCTPV